MTTLFSWFNSRIAETYRLEPVVSLAETLRDLGKPGISPVTTTASPVVILRRLGAPPSLLSTFASLSDCEVFLKQGVEALVPDLERREKKRKRSTGQFYTPENLAARLAEMAEPDTDGDILDPACGDGSFMMAMAACLQRQHSLCHCEESMTTKQSLALSNPCHLRLRREHEHENKSGEKFLDRLYGYDIDIQALFICLTRLICAFPGCGWPVLEKRDFLLDPPERHFSVIIGNPPYRVNLDDDFKLRLLQLYQTGEGEKDLYTFFIEGSLRALDRGGRLIMLTSHTYLVNHQCSRIRRFIFADYHVRALLMLPARFFALAPGVLPVVLIVDADKSAEPYQLDIFTEYSEAEGWRQKYSAAAQLFEGSSGLRQAIVPAQLQQVFAAMNICNRLDEHYRVGVGIQESLKREGKVSRYVCDKPLTESHRPVLRGRELVPFKINWEGKYIDYGSHLAYAGCAKTFANAKILYQNIRNERLKVRLVAAYDKGRYFPKNSLSFVVAKSTDYSELFVLGLLNSLLVNAWFSGNFHSFHITVTQTRQIPLPQCSKALKQSVEDLASRLIETSAGSQNWHKYIEQLNLRVCESYLGAGDHSQLLIACDKFLEQAAAL
ncbi:MAG: N-6 DNA methylase [Candidatus Riflebacteria bacterium]|nr:N-6 DNA methylase [Candidatus Riflebacteria bacterium]